jgi:DNA-binding LacI/PurR family transcriptional regulator/DNA-binding transcriptional regulator YhcF (GntR family)
VPKYLAVKRTLLDRISQHSYGPAERLPSDAELAVEFGVSPMTARRALQELVGHGLIVRSRGRGNGTFLKAGVPVQANHQDHTQRLARLGVLHRQDWKGLRSTPVYFQTFMDIQGACAKSGTSLEFLPAAEKNSASDLTRLARKSGCQALIVMDWHDPAELVKLQGMGLPVVVAGPFLETTPLSFVEPNDCQGAYAATRHLIELGHPTVGLLEHRQVSRVSAQRRAGWQMATGSTGEPLPRFVYRAGRAMIGSGIVFSEVKAELIEQFRLRPPPSALFARDGLFAYAAIQALAELGVKCPADVSIACIGRYYEGAFDMPHMTSAQIEEGALGREVVSLADDLASGRRTGPVGVVLPMHMVEGQTTLRARKQN